jgi:hypothetical protein
MATLKLDLKRELRELYSPGREPALVDVPELSFLMIDGRGDPNTSAEFAQAIQALYGVAYGAKFAHKHSGGTDFTVMPLEGLFWEPDMADVLTIDKSSWYWTIMIAQPDEVTPELIAEAREKAARKHASEALERLRLGRFHEGPAAQVMYVGPYSDEGPAIERLHAFIAEQGLERSGRHHEIYLGDPRRTAPERLRTIIRQPVAQRTFSSQ